jgi:integrase
MNRCRSSASAHEQVWALADAVEDAARDAGLLDPHTYADLTLVLAYCGLRIGEARSLRWRDLKDKTITVRASTTKVDGMGYVEDTTKTHRTRWVPVPGPVWERLTHWPPPWLVPTLRANHREATLRHLKYRDFPQDWLPLLDQASERTVAKVGSEEMGKKLRADWLVFPANRSLYNFLKDAEYRAVFDKAAARIGVKGLTPHELRHTCASLSIQAGANVKAVQRLLGHATATMTLDPYGHLFDDDLVAVADALDKAMRNCGITAVPETGA